MVDQSLTGPPPPLFEKGYASTRPVWQLEGMDEANPAMRWPTAGQIFRKMVKDDAQCSAMLLAITLPIRRTPWRLDPNGAREQVVAHVASDLDLPIQGGEQATAVRTGGRFTWAEHLEQALTSLPYGHAFFEQVYRLGDDGLLHLRKLGHRMPLSISAINVARDGGLISIEQPATALGEKPVTLGVERLVAYVHQREAGDWRGTSLLRPAYKHWLLKDRALQGWRNTNDRNGQGVPIYEGAPGETDLSEGRRLATSHRGGSTAGAALPSGAKLRMAGVEGNLPLHEPEVKYHDEQIARAVLAHFLTLGDKSSYALGVTFADFFTMSLQTIAKQLADTATSHIVEDLVDVNYGPDERAPRIVFDEIGSRQGATAADVAQLLASGVLRPDRSLEESLRQKYGLPPKDTPPPTEPYDPGNPPTPGGAT